METLAVACRVDTYRRTRGDNHTLVDNTLLDLRAITHHDTVEQDRVFDDGLVAALLEGI